MKGQDYSINLTVDATASQVFNNINSVSEWWTNDLNGDSRDMNDEFTVRFSDIHVSTQKLIELIPDKKVVWLVTDSNLKFIKDKQEWTDTKIIFEIFEHDKKTQISFTHFGLAPGVECYNSCVKGWDYFIKGSLYKLLTEGKGNPGLM